MKNPLLLLALLMLPSLALMGQSDYVISKPKTIKAEHAPKPSQYKTQKLNWGGIQSACTTANLDNGAWFKFFPLSNRVRIRVSCGMTWGTLTKPLVYMGHIDTVEGVEMLKEIKCEQFKEAQGDFTLDVFGLTRDDKYFILITGGAPGESFSLNLTHRFRVEEPVEEVKVEPEKPKPVVVDPTKAKIFGRIKGEDGKPLQGFTVELLNDDLVRKEANTTDVQGVFKFYNIDPHSVLLVRMTDDDSKLDVKMFLYDHKGQVIGKARKLGHRLYSFHPRDHFFREITILTEQDVVVDVTQGESGMVGKVVDKETFLIGKKGARVGLYSHDKKLLSSIVTDDQGRFEFTDLTEDEYIVKVDYIPDEDYVEIVLVDDLNVPYSVANSTTQDDEGYFRFEKLPEEKVQLKRMEAVDHGPLKMDDLSHLEDLEQPITLETIKFKSNSSELSQANNEELNLLSIALEDQPTVTIKITGHTDNVGTEGDNLVLSMDRAERVKEYLVTKGIAGERIKCEGFGSLRPLESNDTPEGREHNRRVEIEVIH